MTPSLQQVAFYDWVQSGSGSCVLEAVAGAGKTTTIIGGLNLMAGDVFFGAFNKAIALEIKTRAPARQGLDVSTMHAAGFRFWRRAAPKVRIEGDKCRIIYREASSRYPEYRPLESAVLKLVGYAKQSGLGTCLGAADAENFAQLIDHYDIECVDPKTSRDTTELIIKLAHKTLAKSVELNTEIIDFDDMIYAPLYHDVKVWAHDWVLIDEAQDTNRTRRELALRMLKKSGRLVAVGDPHQAIYGFTGADNDSLELIRRATNAITLPLTVTYRCPKSVVAHAQQWVSHIQAHETAPDGVVRSATLEQLTEDAKPGDAVLCRFTAPLVTNAYAFIAKGIPARIEGRDIAEGLKALTTRWKTDSLNTLEKHLDTYLENERVKLMAKGRENKIVALEDKVACLRVIIVKTRAVDRKSTVETLLIEIDRLFGEGAGPAVTFSTIHKAKGREWNRVVWLTTGGSPYARKEWELEQEKNLCYVAATRSKNELVLIGV